MPKRQELFWPQGIGGRGAGAGEQVGIASCVTDLTQIKKNFLPSNNCVIPCFLLTVSTLRVFVLLAVQMVHFLLLKMKINS